MRGAHHGALLKQIERLFRIGTVSGLSEDELLERIRARRDESSFEALVLRHGPMVWGVCRRLLRNLQDAEDAFQATFLILLSKVGSLRDPSGVSPWLYGVAYRVALRPRRCDSSPQEGTRGGADGSHRIRHGQRSGSFVPCARRGDSSSPREVPQTRDPLLPGRPQLRGSRTAPQPDSCNDQRPTRPAHGACGLA